MVRCRMTIGHNPKQNIYEIGRDILPETSKKVVINIDGLRSHVPTQKMEEKNTNPNQNVSHSILRWMGEIYNVYENGIWNYSNFQYSASIIFNGRPWMADCKFLFLIPYLSNQNKMGWNQSLPFSVCFLCFLQLAPVKLKADQNILHEKTNTEISKMNLTASKGFGSIMITMELWL